MVPVQNSLKLGHLLQALHNYLHHIFEVPDEGKNEDEKDENETEYLRLA